jgi:hypothetical protein
MRHKKFNQSFIHRGILVKLIDRLAILNYFAKYTHKKEQNYSEIKILLYDKKKYFYMRKIFNLKILTFLWQND